MKRSFEAEIMDDPALPAQTLERAHRGIARANRAVGNYAAVVNALRQDGKPLRRVLDIGCGRGVLMSSVRRRMGVQVVGVDLRLPEPPDPELPIIQLDAVRQPLPPADVAVCVCLAHHLRDEEFIELIRNVGRACRRFVVVDLVRHPVPLTLFTAFAPVCLPRVNVLDGRQSIRRAYTPPEFRALVARALGPAGGTFQHIVSPLWIRQIADIRF